ncbi:hypothetical protein FHS26_006017 [Rhizobium pisi]|uniref:Uncharacterized protein n=1 Tax=Rhizobium pisi TaxID=574561 RepID=A0A4R0CG23_9HYPH|nr:hypothetical protein [Rhizobium pisi]MBB3138239.1 hypothetical protein [Rhizobium pisi]TCA40255.1 hypothetical protein E0J16_34885 [Rhizobium pisi]
MNHGVNEKQFIRVFLQVSPKTELGSEALPAGRRTLRIRQNALPCGAAGAAFRPTHISSTRSEYLGGNGNTLTSLRRRNGGRHYCPEKTQAPHRQGGLEGRF